MYYSLLSEAYAKKGEVNKSFEMANTALIKLGLEKPPIKDTKRKSKKSPLSDDDQDFLKQHSSDVEQLKARHALDKAILDLQSYHDKFIIDKTALENKRDETKNLSKQNSYIKKIEAIDKKITAIHELRTNISPLLITLVQEPTEENKKAFLHELHKKDKILGTHRGFGKHFAFFKDTTSIKKVKEIEKRAHVLAKTHPRK